MYAEEYEQDLWTKALVIRIVYSEYHFKVILIGELHGHILQIISEYWRNNVE